MSQGAKTVMESGEAVLIPASQVTLSVTNTHRATRDTR